MPLFITTTNKDIAVNSFKTRGYPICFNKTTDYREIYIVDPSNDTKYIYDGHGTRMTIGAQNNTGGGLRVHLQQVMVELGLLNMKLQLKHLLVQDALIA